MNIVQHTHEKTVYLYHAAAQAEFDHRWFDAEYLNRQGLVLRTAKGRGITYFFKPLGQTWVLRHYWRGGLVGRLLSDAYVWLGLTKARAYQELHLLDTLQRLNLPAPKPVAARIVRSGLVCRSDIITTCIAGASTLIDQLAQTPDQSLWVDVAELIAKFHQAGVFHADLNAANVLLDEQGIWHLIDFDRGRRYPSLSLKQRQNNLARFKRSLLKEKAKRPQLQFTEADWLVFSTAYNKAVTA